MTLRLNDYSCGLRRPKSAVEAAAAVVAAAVAAVEAVEAAVTAAATTIDLH